MCVGVAEIGHAQAVHVIGVQDNGVGGGFHHDTLDDGQFLERVDTAHAQVVGGHVQAGRYIAALIAKARADESAARGFHHREIDGGSRSTI
jgi:hypothetical protein